VLPRTFRERFAEGALDSLQEERAAGGVTLLDTPLINRPSHRRDQP
jgi:hypothetical protein